MSALDEILPVLRCPLTGQTMRVATARELSAVNRRIVGREDLKAEGGEPVTDELDGALVTEDGNWFYPIESGFAILLRDSALHLPASEHPANQIP